MDLFQQKIRFLILVSLLILTASNTLFAQKIAVLKYNGGGDWYANPTALPNLIEFSNKNINTKISKNPESVAVGSNDIFNYPIVFMTGHGNVFFSESEAENLRNYLKAGGFLHISDNYGLDEFIRREMLKVFPKLKFVEIPYSHPIYNQTYKLANGLPKIHQHNNQPPQGFGIFVNNRLVCFYDYESDLSDGWENKEIHNNSDTIRKKALQMGANIIQFAFSN